MFIHKSTDDGATWNPTYFKGKFMKTDCEWDADNKKVSVKVDPLDDYTDVIGGLEKEYNLIELLPELNSVSYRKRVLAQTYIQGYNTISCINNGMYWEQPCDNVYDENELRNKFHFYLSEQLAEIQIEEEEDATLDIAGTYTGKNGLYDRVDGKYFIRFDRREGSEFNLFSLYSHTNPYSIVWSQYVADNPLPQEHLIFRNNQSEFQYMGWTNLYRVWSRILLDNPYFKGVKSFNLPQDDITGNNSNYRYCIDQSQKLEISISGEYSKEPTKYGKRPDNLYYKHPSNIGSGAVPFLRNNWAYASLWIDLKDFDIDYDKDGRQTATIKDCYDFASSINVILKKFAPNIKHEATTEYSEFLYGKNPISKETFKLMLTQKSNVLHGNVEQAASIANTTLMSLLNMLRDCFRCYWFIEDGKLKIEHVEWFRNGGSYTDKHEIAEDLTKMKNPKNGKPWDFGKSQWSFDKQEMPERFKFGWMDNVSPTFNGFPIEVLSKYVQSGKIEDVNVAQFTTDIDFMLMSPSEVSKDGFALFGAINENAIQVNSLGSEFDNGYINEKGEVKKGYNQSEIGYRWRYLIFEAFSAQDYILIDKNGNKIENSVYWYFYGGAENGRAKHNKATVRVPNDCVKIGVCFKESSAAFPNEPINVIQDYKTTISGIFCQGLSLPFVADEETKVETQNGYL
ncbi:MAG: hypothetical protein ACRCZZ_01025, partial [Phocaeicola sp.]